MFKTVKYSCACGDIHQNIETCLHTHTHTIFQHVDITVLFSCVKYSTISKEYYAVFNVFSFTQCDIHVTLIYTI